jgi:polyamine oxidase
VTDEESRRIEQQSDNQTKAEIMDVLRKMFPGKDVPDATDILVPRWWSDRLYKGSFSNWPIGVNRHEYDQLRVRILLSSHISLLYVILRLCELI